MNKPLIRPSDAKAWTKCARRVWLDNKGEFEAGPVDPFDQMVIDLGLAHEQSVLQDLQSRFDVHEAASVEDTARLMEEQVDIIYQAQLFDELENVSGYPDFLIRHASGEYQPADAKLSLSEAKKEIQVQLGLYRRMLGTTLPAIVYLGDGSSAEVGDEADAVTTRFVSEMRDLLLLEEEPPVRYANSKCRACDYYLHCRSEFEAREEPSLLYGVDGRAVPHLGALGINSISRLAAADDADSFPDVPYLKGPKKRRAILQARSWFDGRIYQTGEVILPEGQWIHFDIEDNPLTESGEKHVYLWGFLEPDYEDGDFRYVWTDHDGEDRDGWMQFITLIDEYRQRYPSLILAHFSSHERTTIAKYAQRYDMVGHDTVCFLLDEEGPLFDLRRPVLENLVLPLQAYGLKDICKHPDLVNFQWEDEGSGAQWSVVQFCRFLEEEDLHDKDVLKQAILGYNRDDVRATRKLEEWLRREFVGRIPQEPVIAPKFSGFY